MRSFAVLLDRLGRNYCLVQIAIQIYRPGCLTIRWMDFLAVLVAVRRMRRRPRPGHATRCQHGCPCPGKHWDRDAAEDVEPKLPAYATCTVAAKILHLCAERGEEEDRSKAVDENTSPEIWLRMSPQLTTLSS